MTKPWNFVLFAESVLADVALRVAGLFAKSAETKDDHTIAKAMLMQLAGLGIERAEIEAYPVLEELLRGYTAKD